MLPGTQQGPALHPLNSFSRKRSQYPSFTGRVYCSVFLSRHRPKKKRKPLVFRLRAASFRALWLSQNAGTHRVRSKGVSYEHAGILKGDAKNGRVGSRFRVQTRLAPALLHHQLLLHRESCMAVTRRPRDAVWRNFAMKI